MSSIPTRYYAGKAPKISGFHSDDSDDENHQEKTESVSQPRQKAQSSRRPRIAARIVTPANDVTMPELRRGTDLGFVPVTSRSTRIHKPFSGDDDDGDSSASSESDSGSEDNVRSSESADDDGNVVINHTPCREHLCEESSEDNTRDGVQPVFHQPDLRATQRKHDEDVERIKQREQERQRLRYAEARRLMAQSLKEEEQRHAMQTDLENFPDDEDRPEYHDADFALWRVREILRIHRDRDEQNTWEKRTVVSQRSTNGTDNRELLETKTENDDRQEDTPKLGSNSAHNKSVLLQRRIKIGPFFMEKSSDGRYSEDIYNREHTTDQ